MTTPATASAFTPLRVATKKPLEQDQHFSYFYNGEFLYCYGHQAPFQLTRLTALQFSKLKNKPFGIADPQHVVIANQVLNQAPQRCKRIGKHAHFYFVIAKQVYRLHTASMTLQRLEQADASSFKVVDELIAEDNAHVFLKGSATPIPKNELGEYSIGHFEPLLLRGQQRLWLAGDFLDIDVSSSTFSRIIDDFSQLWVLQGEDAAGPFSIAYCRPRHQVQVLRGEHQQQQLTTLNQQAAKQAAANQAMQLPLALPDNINQRWQQLRCWFTDSFLEKWQRYGDHERFYKLLAACLSSCQQVCQASSEHDNRELSAQALAIYHAVVARAGHACHFIVPSLLAQVISLHAERGDAEQLVIACQRAAVFDLEALTSQQQQLEQCVCLSAQQRATIQRSIDFYQQHPQAVSVALFDYHEQLCQRFTDNHTDGHGEALLTQVRTRLSYHYQHFTEAELNQHIDTADAEQQPYWRRLKQHTADYFNRYMLLDCPFSLTMPAGQHWLQCFQRYADDSYLNPLAFICVADQLFRHAHHWAEWREQHFTDASQGEPLNSQKLMQSKALFEHFEQRLQRLDSDVQQLYRQQAMAYPSYRLLHAEADK